MGWLLNVALVILAIGGVGFLGFFLVATSIGTQVVEPGTALIRTGPEGPAVATSGTITASFVLNRLRTLDLSRTHALSHQQRIRTEDRERLQVTLRWVWAVPQTEADLLMMLHRLGYQKGTATPRLEAFLQPQLKAIFEVLGPQFAAAQWLAGDAAIQAALLRYVAPQQYGFSVRQCVLTAVADA